VQLIPGASTAHGEAAKRRRRPSTLRVKKYQETMMFGKIGKWPNHAYGIALTALATMVGAPASAADPALIAAAKKEGQVVWYTTQIVNQFVRPAAAAFEQKYGIKVKYVRADSKGVTLRVLNEGTAGRVQADVFDGTAGVAPLKKQNLVAKFVPESAARLNKQFVDPQGYWTATNLYVLSPSYNTNLVTKADAPKTFEDLLNPRWKGKIAWNATATMSGAGGFVGLIVETMGEQKGRAYLKKLAQQQIFPMHTSAREVLNHVIVGESALSLNIFNNHAVISAAKGAPVAWIPMQPVVGVLSVASLTRDAPHPNAGKLLIDFLVSPEGQKIFYDADYIPIDPKLEPRYPELKPDGVKLKAVYFSPEQIEQLMPKWMSIHKEYFQ
jgi:ABC-type Fe3+ transport system substrate-binding protein